MNESENTRESFLFGNNSLEGEFTLLTLYFLVGYILEAENATEAFIFVFSSGVFVICRDVTITTMVCLLHSTGEAQSLEDFFSMKQIESHGSESSLNGAMASATQNYPRVPRKKTLEQQAVVDEILQVVADQGRRLSLSQTDYSVQKRIEFGLRRQKRLTSEGSSFDDSSSCTSTSDLSSSPPPTRQSSISSFSDESSKMFEFSSRPRTLPPLNRNRAHRPCRATPPKFDFDEEREMVDSAGRLSRPRTARGQRSRPQRGFTL